MIKLVILIGCASQKVYLTVISLHPNYYANFQILARFYKKNGA
jgi:hypothetical protein